MIARRPYTAAGRASKQSFDAGEQFHHLERLRQIIIGASLRPTTLSTS